MMTIGVLLLVLALALAMALDEDGDLGTGPRHFTGGPTQRPRGDLPRLPWWQG
jgi:hypothetical protein